MKKKRRPLTREMLLGDSYAELRWASGEKTGNELAQTDIEDLLASPYVKYQRGTR